MTKAIVTKDVVKKYKLYESSKERMLDLISPKEHGDNFYALNGVSFEADKGDVVGFIGINGSGKSTLSNIIAGIVPETSGDVQVNGQPALIAVAAGLNDDLTGRDNIELKCLMLGFSKEEIKALEPEIIEFSELENFIDQPVKSYSSGMKSRLGFAISVKVDPDILIIDEALSVGDRAFADKSLKKMMEFKDQGKTMIFVSHSIGQMKTFCDKILWLEFGRVKAYGDVKDVLPLYEAFLNKWQNMQKEEKDLYRSKVMAMDPKNIKYKKMGKLMVLDNEEELEESHTYSIRPVSRLAHLKAYTTYIFEAPNSDENKRDAQILKNKVYYVKREATYQFENYYLLSTEPSGVDGVIGWIRGIETSSHVHTVVDFDKKTFYLLGRGFASTEPWGGKKQYVHETLEHHAGLEFNVVETVLVGNNTWYRGTIDKGSDLVWIHSNNVVTSTEELDTL
ncbi:MULTISPECIES: teichoic acids export ABC transporter ATP-binding subunit TagH [Jeotgalicoccus]|uniref:teichoic acids export ABC transporter ATP-binding subunit TagH n=1 Tax=Jeotgalicoccus TaxID=227979 RepID=UPI0003FA14E4|nr:teichoic acids export ABC transporter ATP-binding subunit TagH [Jeotgalicoccus sp. ATCC 8456]